MPKTMEDRLNSIRDQFKTAKAQYDQRFGGVKIDEGEYVGCLQRCELSVRRSDDATVISTEYRISGGKFDGYVAFDQMNLDNEWGKIFAIRFVEVAGYQFPEQEDPAFAKKLISTLSAIAKDANEFKIEVRQNGDFTNVIPKELISGGAFVKEDEPESKEEVEDTKVVEKITTATTSSKARKRNEPVEEEKEKPVSKIPNFDKLDRTELKKFVRENGLDIRVTAKLTDEDLRKGIKQAMGVDEEEKADEKDVPSDDQLKESLLVLCKAQGVTEVKSSMSLDDMIDIIEGYEMKRDELEDDEIELLETLQLSGCIKD